MIDATFCNEFTVPTFLILLRLQTTKLATIINHHPFLSFLELYYVIDYTNINIPLTL